MIDHAISKHGELKRSVNKKIKTLTLYDFNQELNRYIYYTVPVLFTLPSTFCIWTKNLTQMSQLTSNIIISCCQSYLPNSPSKTARPKLVGNYIVFTSFFPIIHCVSYFRFKSKEVEVSSCLAII